MKYFFLFLISQSILLPIIAGLIRFHRIDKRYRPFLLLLFIGFIVEIISFSLIRLKISNGIALNIYKLIEWLLIAWQFHVWGLLQQKKNLFYALMIVTSLLWAAECVVFGMDNFSPYFLFFYSFLIVLLSINKINFMITHEMRNLFINPRFLICIGFIIYFIYMIVDYWASEISKLGKPEISITLVFWGSYINVLANIIYATAFLLIPKPQKFTLS
jgi:hypothetical protein